MMTTARAALATMGREWRQLFRDPIGLGVLFLMPAVLVLVLSLVQDNVARSIGQVSMSFLLVDPDCGDLGRHIEARLHDANITTIRRTGDHDLTSEEAIALVRAGRYQCAVEIPQGLETTFIANAVASAQRALGGTSEPPPLAPPLAIHFDPIAQGAFRGAVMASLDRALAAIETRARNRALAGALDGRLREALPPGLVTDPTTFLPRLDPTWSDNSLLTVVNAPGGRITIPNAAQQNVPAWTIFGMFFIVLPLAGSLLRERQHGTLARLRSLGVPSVAVVGGKAAAFLLVAAIQVTLMIGVGLWLLPALGTDRIDLGTSPLALLAITSLTACAAVAYGLAVGAVARSYEQASTFGALSVVTAAAIGGIMVPLAAMPHLMQSLALASPLAWSHQTFMGILVRGEGLTEAWPQLTALAIFTALGLMVASTAIVREGDR